MARKCNISEETRAKRSAQMRAMNAARVSHTPRAAALLRAAMLEKWKDPKFQELHRTGTQASLALRWQNENFRAAASERFAAAQQDPEFLWRKFSGRRRALVGCPPEIECPRWVPDSLQSEFFEVAAASDEIEAARHIRALKAEMSAA